MNELPIIDAEFEDIITPSTKKQIVVVNKIVKPKRIPKQKTELIQRLPANNGMSFNQFERQIEKGFEQLAVGFVRGLFR